MHTHTLTFIEERPTEKEAVRAVGEFAKPWLERNWWWLGFGSISTVGNHFKRTSHGVQFALVLEVQTPLPQWQVDQLMLNAQ